MNEYVKMEVIEKFIQEKGWTHTQFCKECKIGYNTFLKLKRANYSVRITAMFKIAKVKLSKIIRTRF